MDEEASDAALDAAASDAAEASDAAFEDAADDAAAWSADASLAVLAELEALDGALPPPQALSIRLAARTIGSPAISLICMEIFLFGRNVVRQALSGALDGSVTTRTAFLT